MLWLAIRLIGFLGGVILVAGGCAMACVWKWDIPAIDEAYEREMRSQRAVSIAPPIDERLPVENRGRRVAQAIADYLESIRLPTGESRVTKAMVGSAQRMDRADWMHTVFYPRLRRFLPLLYIRLETYVLVYLFAAPFVVIAYLYGQYHARQRMRQGHHKRYVVVDGLIWVLRGALWLGVAAIGVVVCPAVAWWIVPSVILSGAIVGLVAANMIEVMG